MKVYDATETAYKNGYAKGYADGVVNAMREIVSISQESKQIKEIMKEMVGAKDGK